MKTLGCIEDVAELRQRFATLSPGDAALWGEMAAGEAICHLREAYRFPLQMGEAPIIKGPIPPAVMKRLALRVPMKWPKGVPTIPELKVGESGLQVGEFFSDRDGLLQVFDQFCAGTNYQRAHPFFGAMKHEDWLRWGYLHGDHHLRQFGR